MTEPTDSDTQHLVKTRLIALLNASRKSIESRKSLKKFDALKLDLMLLVGFFSSTNLLAKDCKAGEKEKRNFIQENESLQGANDTTSHATTADLYDPYNHNTVLDGAYSSNVTNDRKRKRNDCYGTIENHSREEDCFSTCSERSLCDKFLYSPISSPEYSFLEEEINCDHDGMKEDIKSSMSDYDWRQQKSSIKDRDEAFRNPYSPIRCNYLDKDVPRNVYKK